MSCEDFKFEKSYYDALQACLDRIFRLMHDALKRVLPIGPGDPAWIWEERLSPWVEGVQLQGMAEVATGCTALEKSEPAVAHQLRSEAALVGRVPAQALIPTQVSRGTQVSRRVLRRFSAS